MKGGVSMYRLIKDTTDYVDPDYFYNDKFEGYMAESVEQSIADIETIKKSLIEKGWKAISENEISNEEISVKLTLNPCVLYTTRMSSIYEIPDWVPKPFGLFGYGISCEVEDLQGNTLNVMEPLDFFYGDISKLSHWYD
jgi:hypothetical protein